MMSLREDVREAVIIVDMQKDNVGRFCGEIIPNIKLLIDDARRRGRPVIYACDSRFRDDPLFRKLEFPEHAIRGTKGAEVIDEIKPQQGDILVEKRMLSAFFGTDLDYTLRHKNIKSLIIAGIRTEACLLKTVLDAFELGYDVTVPSDACSSPSQQNHEATLKILDVLKIRKVTTEQLLAVVEADQK
ncbi:cysteine hydrolase [Candidatus Bathyarchaeota archaeon]|nr:cysteine hydrolase [Candidatus Bathyarchaeota archaeon]